jgi:hypothetical protein
LSAHTSLIRLTRGISSAGRAPALQAGGQRFDPAMLHQRQALLARRRLSDRQFYVYKMSRALLADFGSCWLSL